MENQISLEELRAVFLPVLTTYFAKHDLVWFDPEKSELASETVDVDTIAVVEIGRTYFDNIRRVYAKFTANDKTMLADIDVVDGKVDWIY